MVAAAFVLNTSLALGGWIERKWKHKEVNKLKSLLYINYCIRCCLTLLVGIFTCHLYIQKILEEYYQNEVTESHGQKRVRQNFKVNHLGPAKNK